MDTIVKDKVLSELSTAKKYLNKTLFLFENHDECIKVVKSSRKAQRALENARKIMLEGHLSCCLREKIKSLNGNREFYKIVQFLSNKK
ncbi:MAG TPA: metal-sensing transcriptional repressor [Patescibacteria group bacterium]|nr:metal-sensing transcriptional repressor [Patescibacteria group bacterium]